MHINYILYTYIECVYACLHMHSIQMFIAGILYPRQYPHTIMRAIASYQIQM